MAEGDKEKKEVLVNPENWDEMVKKYHERDEEQLQKALEKKQVSSIDELKEAARKAIVNRSVRVSSEYQSLKTHEILVYAKSPEIKTLREQLSEEIAAYAKEVLKQFPALYKAREALKGRVTIGAPGVPELQETHK